MPNITLSVSNELKIKMDRLSEVSWSDVCRNAILEYIEGRGNRYEIIESENIKFVAYIDPVIRRRDNKLVYMLKILNHEDFDLVLDRVSLGVQYTNEGGDFDFFDHPITLFEMMSVKSNQQQLVSSFDTLSDELKSQLLLEHDEKGDVNWTMFGTAFFHSKKGIIKTGFHIPEKLDENLSRYIQAQTAI